MTLEMERFKKMENVKLTYFIQNGRVGLLRAMLCYKKVPFENIMLSLVYCLIIR